MLTEALEYPRAHDDWLKTILIGGVLSLFSWLIVPGIILAGYIVHVLRGSMRGDEVPPAFDDWGQLLSDGLRAAIIALVYSLVPAVLFMIVAVFGGLLAAGGGDLGSGMAVITVLLGGLLALVVGLAAAYVLPAALANYAETDEMSAGFSWSALRPVLFNGTYATAWVTAFAIVLAAGIVTGVLNVVPFLGVVVGAFVSFYAAVSAYYVIGNAWADLHPIKTAETDNVGKSTAI